MPPKQTLTKIPGLVISDIFCTAASPQTHAGFKATNLVSQADLLCDISLADGALQQSVTVAYQLPCNAHHAGPLHAGNYY